MSLRKKFTALKGSSSIENMMLAMAVSNADNEFTTELDQLQKVVTVGAFDAGVVRPVWSWAVGCCR